MSTTRSAEAEAWERAWLERARERAGCDAETRTIDPGIEVGVLADGTIRFWCFHMEAPRRYRLSLREGKKGGMPRYTNADETYPSGPAAEAVVARRNRKAVRRA